MPKFSFNPKIKTKKLLTDLNDRARFVITKRFGLDPDGEKKTLEAIGQEFSITRERVRQIENVAIKAIRKSSSFAEAREIFDHLKAELEKYGGIVNHDEFLKDLADDRLTQNHLHFYLVLGEEFHEFEENKHYKKRWSLDRKMAEKVYAILEEIYKGLSKKDLLTESELIQKIKDHDHLKDVENHKKEHGNVKHWISAFKRLGKNPLSEYGRFDSPHISMRGMRDMAYLVMRRHGSPLHFKEVAESIEDLFGKKAHVATCHNELIKDERFVLVGRGLYALREWGYREGVVRDIISDLIKNNGPMTKEEIISAVKKERYLKENTILVNLQNKMFFTKDEDNRYHLV